MGMRQGYTQRVHLNTNSFGVGALRAIRYTLGNRKVAIVGAGYVGSSIAYALALKDAAREIVMIDINHEVRQRISGTDFRASGLLICMPGTIVIVKIAI